MRVGFFTDTFRPNLNGVVVSMECFAAELRRLGCRTVVFAPRTPHTTVPDLAVPGAAAAAAWTPPAAGIERVHWVPSLRFLFEQGQRVALPLNHRLIRIARDERLDLIHTHTPFQMGYAGVRVSRALGLPLLHTYHTYFAEYVHYLK